MHEHTYPLVNKAIQEKKIRGNDLSCEYNPCHAVLEDCTFCYCLFYPCNDESTGGYLLTSRRTGKQVWDCSNCTLTHMKDNAQFILDRLITLDRKLEDITDSELKQIRLDLLNKLRREG